MPDNTDQTKNDDLELEVVIEEEEETSPEPEKSEDSKENSPVEEKKEEKRPDDDDLSSVSMSVRKRIDKLTHKMREAERREQAAIEYAKSLRNEVEVYRSRTDSLNVSLETEFDTRLKTQHQLVTDKLRVAVDRGDVEGQVEAQKQLAVLAVEEERLRSVRLQRQMAPQRQVPVYQEPPAQQIQTPPQPDPRAVNWAEKNTWFGEDEAMTATALSFHRRMVEEEGFDPSSDDYYGELDRRIRREFPHKFERKEAVAKPVSSVAPVASARPASRPDGGKKQVKLTRSQIDLARKLGVSVDEYARQVQKLAR